MLRKIIINNLYLLILVLILNWSLSHFLQVDYNLNVSILLSFSTFFVYVFQQNATLFIKSKFFLVSVLFFSFLLFTTYPLNKSAYFFLFFNFFLSIWYVHPKAFNLRNVPFLKVFLIAFVWVSCFVLFPHLLADLPLNYNLILTMYLYFLLISLPFDIRDYEVDFGTIKTIPHLLGKKRTKYLLFILLSLFIFLGYSFSLFSLSNWFFLLLIIELGIGIYLIDEKNATNFYFLFFDSSLLIISLAFYFEKNRFLL